MVYQQSNESDTDKCHLLMSTIAPISNKVKDYIMKNSNNEKVLGVTVDPNLNWHLENIQKMSRRKVHVLARIRHHLLKHCHRKMELSPYILEICQLL